MAFIKEKINAKAFRLVCFPEIQRYYQDLR